MKKATRKGTGEAATRLRVRIDANHCRTLALAAHEALLAPMLPEILDTLKKTASRGGVSEIIDLVGSKGFTSRDKAAVLMTMRAKLDALGFTVEPRVIEHERIGHSTREPALEVSWL